MQQIKLLDERDNNLVNLLPGQSAQCRFHLHNDGIDLGETYGILRTDNPFVRVLTDSVHFGNAAAQDTLPLQSRPFDIQVSPTARPGRVDCELWLYNENNIPLFPVHTSFYVGPSQVILINDAVEADAGDYFRHLFESRYLSYSVWTNKVRGLIPAKAVDAPLWIWYSGDDAQFSLTAEEQNALMSIVNSDNHLILIGSNVGYDLIEQGTALDSLFYHHVLHARYESRSAVSSMISGNFYYPYWRDLTLSLTHQDTLEQIHIGNVIESIDPAQDCFLYPLDNGAAGIFYDDKKSRPKADLFIF
ncbi:MAG: hypothetical protein U5R06_08050 [candidate division KSB1 bacterium]|nr:hypothetical protein [candidate division KSB1 bacterium]